MNLCPLTHIDWLITDLDPAAAALQPTALLYERTVMAAADARCRLFTPDLGAALEAALLGLAVLQDRGGCAGDSRRGEGARGGGDASCDRCHRSPR